VGDGEEIGGWGDGERGEIRERGEEGMRGMEFYNNRTSTRFKRKLRFHDKPRRG
jgi:hypothetical protein